ncbi:hypothetical protein [Microvirga subterranea]|uniref:Uncharacterized protein n=1 Tax=Microvirga subterranea TaxID=186651 RepID=A0A370HSZ3_9HYPH|nr:hypothetical protein [Microvirga subterranea]RDI61071.1 hypothetical protein DES45_102465 [Microvirga subterranea]
MRRFKVIACVASMLSVLPWQHPGCAGAETIQIDGESHDFVRMSHEESMGRIPSFATGMKRANISGRLAVCIAGLDLPVSTEQGDHRYGAYCLLRRDGASTTVQVCSHETAGLFRIEAVDLTTASIANLAGFVRRHCYGD